MIIVGPDNEMTTSIKMLFRRGGQVMNSVNNLQDFISVNYENETVIVLLDDIYISKGEVQKIKSQTNISRLFFFFFNQKQSQNNIDLLIREGEYEIYEYNDEFTYEYFETILNDIIRDYADVEKYLSIKEIQQTQIIKETIIKEKEYINQQCIGIVNLNKWFLDILQSTMLDVLIIDMDFSHTTDVTYMMMKDIKYDEYYITKVLKQAEKKSLTISELRSSLPKVNKNTYYLPSYLLYKKQNKSLESYINLIKKAKEVFPLVFINLNPDLRISSITNILNETNKLLVFKEENKRKFDVTFSNYKYLKKERYIPMGIEIIYYINNFKGQIMKEVFEEIVEGDELLFVQESQLLNYLNIKDKKEGRRSWLKKLRSK